MAESKVTTLSKNFKNLAGQQFGRLTVVSLNPMRTSNGSAQWDCLCSCGKMTVVIGQELRKRSTMSCGCYAREVMAVATLSHGMSHSKEYKSWDAAKYRCFNSNAQQFRNYGGRGITMSEDWRNSFEQFFKDMGPCPDGMSLDRIDNDGPYTGPCPEYPKGNCRWADRPTQRGNQRKLPRKYVTTLYAVHDGVNVTLKRLAELTGIQYATLRYRHARGLPLTTPVV